MPSFEPACLHITPHLPTPPSPAHPQHHQPITSHTVIARLEDPQRLRGRHQTPNAYMGNNDKPTGSSSVLNELLLRCKSCLQSQFSWSSRQKLLFFTSLQRSFLISAQRDLNTPTKALQPDRNTHTDH